jgi:hypothetical protein
MAIIIVRTNDTGIALLAGHLKITKNKKTETIGNVAIKASVPILKYLFPFHAEKFLLPLN